RRAESRPGHRAHPRGDDDSSGGTRILRRDRPADRRRRNPCASLVLHRAPARQEHDLMSDSFVPVAPLSQLAPGEAIDVVIGGTEIALVRDEDGDVHALEDVCSHQDIPLSDGDVEGCTIECWKHGSQFDLRTGRPLQLPAVLPVPVYPVRVDEATGEISVDPTGQLTP